MCLKCLMESAPLVSEDLDNLPACACGQPDCEASGKTVAEAGGPMKLAPHCHPQSALNALYLPQSKSVLFFCALCNNPVTHLKLASDGRIVVNISENEASGGG